MATPAEQQFDTGATRRLARTTDSAAADLLFFRLARASAREVGRVKKQ
jgi:hypothetical protein